MTERHHLLYNRATWESMDCTKKLRRHPQLIIPMDASIEEELHKNVIMVPPLDIYTTQHVLREFRGKNNVFGTINNLMKSIEVGISHKRTTELQRDIAHLTISAIEQQIPYIKEGIKY